MEKNPSQNSLFELEAELRKLPSSTSSQNVMVYLSCGEKPVEEAARSRVQRILELFEQSKRDLLTSRTDLEALQEHLTTLEQKKSSFLTALMLQKDGDFRQRFNPQENAGVIRILAQFFENTSDFSTKVSLDRSELSRGLFDLLEDLEKSDVSEPLKSAMRISLKAILAMLIETSGFTDQQIRTRIREIAADALLSVEQATDADREFIGKAMLFIKKHGLDYLGRVALIGDLHSTWTLLLGGGS